MTTNPTLSTPRCVESITAHSSALADAAAGHLDRPVEHCPGWTVADLVWHVLGVQWAWATIVGELLAAPPEESRRPSRPPDAELVDAFRAGAGHLAETLAVADQQAGCWTWFPPQQQVAFVTRHQVQEAVVHHFDAANAVGAGFSVAADVAADCVSEFLTTSLADAEDAERIGVELAGELVLAATDTGQSWTVRQAGPAAALLWTADAAGRPTVAGTAAELLLWLYERTALTESDPQLVARFRQLSSRG